MTRTGMLLPFLARLKLKSDQSNSAYPNAFRGCASFSLYFGQTFADFDELFFQIGVSDPDESADVIGFAIRARHFARTLD